MKILLPFLIFAGSASAQPIPIPFDSYTTAALGNYSSAGKSAVNGQNANFYLTTVAGSANRDVTDTYLNPPPTVLFEFQYWGLDNPTLDKMLTYRSALPGGTPTVSFPLLPGYYCCNVYRPFISTYTQPTGPTFPMQLGGRITMTLHLVASPGAAVDIISDTLNADGSPANICGGPPTARVYLASAQTRNYSWTVLDTWDDDNRWFSPDPVPMADSAGNLIPGYYQISTTISGAWTGVFGNSAQNSDGSYTPHFLQSVTQPTAIVLGLGGGCFAAHGWRLLTGTASITIASAYYQP